MRRNPSLTALLLVGTVLSVSWCCTDTEARRKPAAERSELAVVDLQAGTQASLKLLETVTPAEGAELRGEQMALRINPGSEAEAKAYYTGLEDKLVGFPRNPLTESSIGDMLTYYGFPALLAKDLEALHPAVIMDFERLRKIVSNPSDFEREYATRPLQPGEILVTRFFAPKIINVREPQQVGVPVDGFGWRKVLRFRSRVGSGARAAGLDTFYLLFNFVDPAPKFPEGKAAGQIQALVVPIYPTAGRHNDIYFLVYQSLASANPGRVGFFLSATFDLAGVVPDDKYYVPTSCGQCHGTEAPAQVGGKVNYLDTDHWIDRTGDDFALVQASDVLVDGVPQAYDTIRQLNTEIEQQNAAVITRPNDPKFALLAVRKWLELHEERGPDAYRHVPPLRRGLAEKTGDAVWIAGTDPDEELLPLLNQYCFRCHSSVRYHVFQKQAVIDKKRGVLARVRSGNMPQDRQLDQATKDTLIELLEKIQ